MTHRSDLSCGSLLSETYESVTVSEYRAAFFFFRFHIPRQAIHTAIGIKLLNQAKITVETYITASLLHNCSAKNSNCPNCNCPMRHLKMSRTAIDQLWCNWVSFLSSVVSSHTLLGLCDQFWQISSLCKMRWLLGLSHCETVENCMVHVFVC